PTLRPNSQAQLSGPTFRPNFQARLSGPTFRPDFQARLSGVVHAHEVEPACGRDLATGAAITRLKRRTEIAWAPFALANELERTHHGPHLVVQERARRGHDVHLLALGGDRETVEGLDR